MKNIPGCSISVTKLLLRRMCICSYYFRNFKINSIIMYSIIFLRKYFNFYYRANVVLGEYEMNNHGTDCAMDIDGVNDCTDGAISIPVKDIHIHPSYFGDVSSKGDIALIRLARAAPYTGK